MILEILLFYGQPGGWCSRVDEKGCHFVRCIDGACLVQQNRVFACFHGKAGLSKHALCGFKIARSDLQAPRPEVFQLVRVEFFDQTPFVDDADARGEAVHLGENMARHKHGHALLAGEIRQQFTDLDHARRVESVGGFVEDEQLGLVQQCARQAKALEIARRKRPRFSIGVSGKPQAFDDAGRGARDPRFHAGGGRSPGSPGRSIQDRR